MKIMFNPSGNPDKLVPDFVFELKKGSLSESDKANAIEKINELMNGKIRYFEQQIKRIREMKEDNVSDYLLSIISEDSDAYESSYREIISEVNKYFLEIKEKPTVLPKDIYTKDNWFRIVMCDSSIDIIATKRTVTYSEKADPIDVNVDFSYLVGEISKMLKEDFNACNIETEFGKEKGYIRFNM